MAFADPSKPNQADFLVFVREQGIIAGELPDSSPYFAWAFSWALGTALKPPVDMPSILYVLATYNLGLHQLVKIAQDTSGNETFKKLRTSMRLNSFQAGPVTSSSDQGTSQTLAEPEFMKGLTISALDLMKTPWGREYLDYAQQYGPNVVGIS